MSVMSKVAIAVDIIDWPRIEMLVNNIAETHEVYDRTTPDNTYRCIYWDDVCWGSDAAQTLEHALCSFKHAFIEINEEGRINVDFEIYDDRGDDQEFEELLSWTADICFWDTGVPLSPVHPYSRDMGRYMPISRERAIQILSSYVDNDLNATESWYIYEALTNAGASDEEIEALGFGYCIPDPGEVSDEECSAESSRFLPDKDVKMPVHMDCCCMPVQE